MAVIGWIGMACGCDVDVLYFWPIVSLLNVMRMVLVLMSLVSMISVTWPVAPLTKPAGVSRFRINITGAPGAIECSTVTFINWQ